MLEHADGHDAVEALGHRAVILQAELHHVVEPAFGGARTGDGELLFRQRDAGDVGAAMLGEIKGKAAPAGADVEDALAGFDVKLGGDVALLGELRLVQRLPRPLKIGARILLVVVEKQVVEPPVEIVVMRDVAAGTALGIVLRNAPEEAARHIDELGVPGDGGRIRVEHQERQKIGDIAAFDAQPIVHVEFAEGELRVGDQPQGCPAVGKHHAQCRRRPVADCEDPPVVESNLQRAAPNEPLEN
jgi:hypothetical protein